MPPGRPLELPRACQSPVASHVQATMGPAPPLGFKPIVSLSNNHILESKVRNLRGAALLTGVQGDNKASQTSFHPQALGGWSTRRRALLAAGWSAWRGFLGGLLGGRALATQAERRLACGCGHLYLVVVFVSLGLRRGLSGSLLFWTLAF